MYHPYYSFTDGVAAPVAPVVATGGGIGHGGYKKRLIVVDVDGEEFRVPESQLQSFLDSVRETVQEAHVEDRIVKKKSKKAKVEVKPVEVKVLYAPQEIEESVALQVKQSNDLFNRMMSAALIVYLAEIEEEEALLLLM